MVIRFPFNERKAAQAAAYLVWLRGGRCDYRRLIKLLYLADRQAFLDDGLPITGDEMWSMKQGPVLSQVMDAIKRKNGLGAIWHRFLKDKTSAFEISLARTEFDTDELSDYELNVLQRVDREFANLPDEELLDALHRLPEHTVTETRRRIFFEKLIAVTGMPQRKEKNIRALAEEMMLAAG